MNTSELIERLAEKEHEGWSHWMAYLFSVCEEGIDGSVTIPASLVAHWQRQVATPYAQLTQTEKQSDRNQVAHILPIINEYVQADRKPSPPSGESDSTHAFE